MSHYNVNASVPKTLIRYLINWVVETGQLGSAVCRVLRDVLDTEVSPELVPGAEDGGQPSQRTEEVIGPYELHDFFLYYTTRLGYLPSKIAFLAYCCWHDAAQRPVAGRAAGATPRLQDGRGQTLADGVCRALFPAQSIQAQLRAQCAQGRLRWVAVAARRLSRSQWTRAPLCGWSRSGASRTGISPPWRDSRGCSVSRSRRGDSMAAAGAERVVRVENATAPAAEDGAVGLCRWRRGRQRRRAGFGFRCRGTPPPIDREQQGGQYICHDDAGQDAGINELAVLRPLYGLCPRPAGCRPSARRAVFPS